MQASPPRPACAAKKTYQNMTRQSLPIIAILILATCRVCGGQDVTQLKLKDFRPRSIYQVPVTMIKKAKFQAVDMHSHVYAKTDEELTRWMKTMDGAGIEKTIILTGAIGTRFDSLFSKYSRYPDRFELWCGFDLKGYQEPGWSEKAVKELERCVKVGARGIGELSDKGLGLRYPGGFGPHINDPLMKPAAMR
jgi:hypothetical protein